MTEKRLIVDGLEINYHGLFDLKGLLREIDKAASEKGYTKNEKRREENIHEKGGEFIMELRPTKVKTAYFALMVKLRIHITNLIDTVASIDGKRYAINRGDIRIIFDAWTNTDYENRWEQNPLFYFLRAMFDRFIYTTHIDKYVGEVDGDCHYIYNQIDSYLQLHNYVNEKIK